MTSPPRASSSESATLSIVFPKTVEPREVASWLWSLTSGRQRALASAIRPGASALEIVATNGQISHLLTVPTNRKEHVVRQTQAALGGVLIAPADPSTVTYDAVGEWRLRLRPEGKFDAESIGASILASLTMPRRSGEESVMIQWLVAGPHAIDVFKLKHLASILGFNARDKNDEPEPVRLRACFRIGASSPHPDRSGKLLAAVLGAMRSATAESASLVQRRVPKVLIRQGLERRMMPLAGNCSWLEASELAALCGVPIKKAQLTPGLSVIRSRVLPPSKDSTSEGIVIGRSIFPGREQDIAIPWERSFVQIGCITPTGRGKTVLATHIARQSIARGWATVVFDLDGDLAQALTAHIPDHRLDDVIYWNLADEDRPLGWNFVRTRHPAKTAHTIAHAINLIYKQQLGARSLNIAINIAHTLALDPDNHSIVDAIRVLNDRKLRTQLLKRTSDSWLHEFWAGWDVLTPAARAEYIAPIKHRLRTIMQPETQLVFGQTKSSFEFESALATRKIVLINFARGKLSDNADRAAGLVLENFWETILTRPGDGSMQQTAPVLLVLDEFQQMARLSDRLEQILSEGRRRGLAVCTFNQGLHQLDTELRHSLLNNEAHKIVLRTGANDAAVLAKEIGVDPEDIQNLDAYHAYARIDSGTGVPRPVSVRLMPPAEAISDSPAVIERSRQVYGRPRAEV
ncbi:MAG: type IV secretory system conjugative DNA transfer family protein, partial [Actinomycetota bacterium]